MTNERVERFFQSVWRLNALLIAGAGVLALSGGLMAVGLLAWEVFGPLKTQQVAAAPSPSGEERSEAEIGGLQPSGFAPLGRTGLLRAELQRLERPPRTGVSGSFYGKTSRNTADWLVYDPRTSKSWRLVGAESGLLIEARMLEWRAAPGAPASDRAVFVRRVAADSTGDGLLTARDQAEFALATREGRELTVLPVAGAFLSLTLVARDEAVLLTASDAGAVATHLDLAARKVVRTTMLPVGATEVGAAE